MGDAGWEQIKRGWEQARRRWYKLDTSWKEPILVKMAYFKRICIHVGIRLEYVSMIIKCHDLVWSILLPCSKQIGSMFGHVRSMLVAS